MRSWAHKAIGSNGGVNRNNIRRTRTADPFNPTSLSIQDFTRMIPPRNRHKASPRRMAAAQITLLPARGAHTAHGADRRYSKRPSNSLCRVPRTHAISRCQTNGRGDQVGESHYDSVAGASLKRAAISSYDYFAMPHWRRRSRSQTALADSECATYWFKSEHLGAASRPVRRSRVFGSK